MTAQPTRDQLRAHLSRLIAAWDGPGNPSVSTADLAQLLDQLDQAEAELDSWMTRAYEAERKLWKAEARIKAAREWHWCAESRIGYYCAECDGEYPCDTIRALEGKD